MASLFSQLPSELRLEIWELAATTPRVIRLGVGAGTLTAHTRPHPLLHACSESRTIYMQRNGDNLQVKNVEVGLSVNFARDLFLLEGLPWQPIRDFSPGHQVYQLERIAVDIDEGPILDFRVFLSEFPRLQEFWVFFNKVTEQFTSPPASAFRRHWPLHHCYTPDDLPPLPCPTCVWDNGFHDVSIPIPKNWGHFRATLDASLPMFPTVKQITSSRHPQIRCVKVHESQYDGDPREFSRVNPID